MENIRKDFTQQFEQWPVSSFPQNSCFYPNSPNPPQLTQFIQLTPTHLREHLPRKKECFFSSITWIPTDPFLRSNYHPGIFRLNAVQRFAWGSIAPIWGMWQMQLSSPWVWWSSGGDCGSRLYPFQFPLNRCLRELFQMFCTPSSISVIPHPSKDFLSICILAAVIASRQRELTSEKEFRANCERGAGGNPLTREPTPIPLCTLVWSPPCPRSTLRKTKIHLTPPTLQDFDTKSSF